MSSLERLHKQNEAFGCMDEMSRGHRKTGDNMDKRIARFDREIGAQMDSRSKVRKQRSKSTQHGMRSEASKSPDVDL